MSWRSDEPCPWSILGVHRGASSETVREAYRKLALRWHPDQNAGSESARQRFHHIKEAFERIKAHESTTSSFSSGSRQGPNSSGRHAHTSAAEDFARYRYRSDPFTNRQQQHHLRYRTSRFSPLQELRRAFLRARLPSAVQTVAGTALFAAACTVLALASNAAWAANNRGKSFDEMIDSLGKDRPASGAKRSERSP